MENIKVCFIFNCFTIPSVIYTKHMLTFYVMGKVMTFVI